MGEYEKAFKSFIKEEEFTPEDLFDEWRQGEIGVGNDTIEDSYKDIKDENKATFDGYVRVVNKYLHLDRELAAQLVSGILYTWDTYEDFEEEDISEEEFDEIKKLLGVED